MASAALRIPPEIEAEETPAAEPPPTAAELTVDWRRLALRVLLVGLAAEALLFVLDYHVNYGRLIDVGAMRRLFNTAREDGLASWLAATQTLFVGLTFLGLYAVDRARGYLILGLGFCYLAVDDGAQLHERVASTFDALTERSTFVASFPSYTWHVLFLPLFGALGVYLLVFLWAKLERRRPRVVLSAAVACVVLAVGLDFVEGLEGAGPGDPYAAAVERYPSIDRWSRRRFDAPGVESLRHFTKSLEETLEMGAMSLLLFLLLGHVGRTAPEVRIRSG